MCSLINLLISSLLFSTSTMLLLSASDWSGNIVGYGKHFLCNDKIVQLNGNMFIASKKADLERYKGGNDACDVEIAENGDIIIWYRNDIVKKFGCSIDLVTKNEGSIPLQFGVSKSGGLSNCLVKIGNMEGEGGTRNHDATNWNTIPFSFSLKDAEFEKLKSNPQYGKNCGSKEKICKNSGGKCLKQADYSIGWASKSDLVLYAVQPIGEPQYWSCLHDDKDYLPQSSFEIKIRNGGFDLLSKNCEGNMDFNGKKETSCFEKEFIRKPEEWEIVDENYKKEIFKYLFTLYLLPLSAAPKRNIFFSHIMEGRLNEAKCDIFIRLDKNHVKMLTPYSKESLSQNLNPKVQCENSKTTASVFNGKKTSTNLLNTNKTLKTEGTNISKSEGTTNIFFIIGIILIIIIIVALIIYWLVFNRKNKEKEGEIGKTFSETKIDKWARKGEITNIGSEETKMPKTTTNISASSSNTKKPSSSTKGQSTGKTSSQTMTKTGEVFTYKSPRPSTINKVMNK
uniref:Uncharacterized protein n=1 Tax=Meloidogyne enterolobii TaxID=390850 RepID=A0A6V7TLR6_MELEN|nr:unnamed protein product [Meloidogyne enterolobii]